MLSSTVHCGSAQLAILKKRGGRQIGLLGWVYRCRFLTFVFRPNG